MKVNVTNEKIKRRYLIHLKESGGLAESTICIIERAVLKYEQFSNREDFAQFNYRRAIGFKKWLESIAGREKPVSANTAHHTLRHLKRFFIWLADRPGFKSKISLDDVSYLNLDRKTVESLKSSKPVKCPPLEYVISICESIQARTEIDLRDRAVIAFLLIGGMRDLAVASLPIGCLEVETRTVRQDPTLGVRTKFSKSIVTRLMSFDERLTNWVLEWSDHLVKKKLFGPADPLFPRSKVEQDDGSLSFVSREVEPMFWKSANPIRNILKRRAEAAGLEYYRPHSFRHAAIRLALRRCRNAEEVRAISQNFGHENIGTTLLTYGKLDDDRVDDIVGSIDFSTQPDGSMPPDKLDQIIERLDKMERNRQLADEHSESR